MEADNGKWERLPSVHPERRGIWGLQLLRKLMKVFVSNKNTSPRSHRGGSGRNSLNSISGNVFFALFAAVGMVGVLGAGMNTVMRGPVTSMATVSKRTIAENNVIASGKLAIVSATTQQPDSGDCDADSFVEPIPYRDAGVAPHPTGGGFIPTTIGASLSDPWQLEYGYCAWDHGAVTVSDNDPACGGSGANRLEGAPNDTQMAVAIISAGPDMTFQTECNAFVDANVDNVPDVPLIEKTAGSDDIVLGHTYAEANMALGGLWGLKSGEPDTATINKDIEVVGDASFGGSLILGGGLLLPDQTTSGACSLANDQQLRRNTSGPSLEICVWGGGPGAWVPMGGAGAISGLTAAGAPNTIDNLAHLQTWNWNSATTGSGLALGSNSLTSGNLMDINVSNAASTGTALRLSKNSTAGGSVLQVVASGGTGVNMGVYTQVMSTSGTGVAGLASAASGTTYGIYGVSSSPSGYGGYGGNSAAAGTGLWGEAASGAGTGVLGSTPSTTANAAGVKGTASGTSGATYGVLGSNASASGFGVSGTNSASAGTGVSGVANTGAATGVIGSTTSTTNTATGVRGVASGASGTIYGGYFSANSTSGAGVFGTSQGTGVSGQATATSGWTIGVYGENNSTSGEGVYGAALAATGGTAGVRGSTASTSGAGVRGAASATSGWTMGVYGDNNSTSGDGVYGAAWGATGNTSGVRGTAASTSGAGVRGGADAASGTNYGVYGFTNSAAGYGAYFDNTAGGWGIFSADDMGITAGKYFNWGTTRGTTGYGIWDDAGVMKVKNSGGSWTAIAGGAETDPQVGTLTNTKWCTTDGTVINCTSDTPGGGGVALSGITAAGGTNTINNAANTQTWNWNSLTTGTGLALGSTSLTSGYLLSVTASNASSNGAALRAETTSTSGGAAIMADATGASSMNYGVYARSYSTTGIGVFGTAPFTGVVGYSTALSGVNFGGDFAASSTSGVGIRGVASAISGTAYGVYGLTSSPSGYGGYFANAGSGWGLYSANDAGLAAGKYLNWGATQGTSGYGIRDNAGTIECKNSGGAWAACAGGGGGGAISALTAAAGTNTINNAANIQTWDWNSLTTAQGLRLRSSSITSGTVLDVWGTNTSMTGNAIYSYAANGNAVYGDSGSSATAGSGVYGSAQASATYGVLGLNSASGATAIYGIANNSGGTTTGVYGRVNSTAAGARGVYGQAAGASGANYGVYGTSASATGYAGYFDNTSTGWGLYSADDVGLTAGKYLNWGATQGTSGYGIRDNAGTIECKNSGGAWAACAGGGGGGAISALTAAAGANTIDNGAHTQTWDWNSITTGNGLNIGSTSITNASLLSVAAMNAAGNGNAILAQTNSTSGGQAVRAIATGASGVNYGVSAQVSSSTGIAVYGVANGASAYGGYFLNGSGWGVFSTGDVGLTASKYLNWGTTRGTSGYGIRDNAGTIECKNSGGAWAACAGGGGGTPGGANTQIQFNNSGAFGASANLTWDGTTLLAQNSSGSAGAVSGTSPAIGVYGSTASTTGTAVMGESANSSGTNYGVRGLSASTAGTGVYGGAGANSGTNYGVYGTSASASGYAGYFSNTADGWGLYSLDDVGLAGSKYINWGATRGSTGYGIRDNAGTIECKNSGGAWAACAGGGGGTPAGANTQVQFNNSGAFGASANLTWDGNRLNVSSGGLYGIFASTSVSSSTAVYGGASGSGQTYGVWGSSSSNGGQGVTGWATSASGTTYGVKGLNDSANGFGVHGEARASSGVNYGIYGTSASASGYAGYFDNTNAGGGWGVYTADDLGIGAGKYMNFGGVRGSGGYGIWDDAGVIKVKNSGGSWAALGGGGASLSGLTAATGTNTINNVANTQTWNWDSLAGGNGLVLGSTGATTGTLLSVTVNSGYAIRATATSSYGLYATVTDGTAVYGNSTVALGNGVRGRGVAGGYGGLFMNTGATAGSYAIYCQATHAQGCAGSQNWFNASDRRLKERIVDLPDERGIDAIMKLRPVTYHWKDKNLDEGGGQRIGLIAQEVEAVFPESVGSGNKTVIDLGDGKTETVEATKSMAYSDLVVPLIKAVQQQQAQIEDLKAANDNLRARLDAVEKK